MKSLTRQEEIFLLAIWRLQDDAYGVKIRKQIKEMAGKTISYGALYFTLEQVTKKGYVARTVGDPTPVRGGCSKIYYHLTNRGKKALKSTYQLQMAIWEGLSGLSFDSGDGT